MSRSTAFSDRTLRRWLVSHTRDGARNPCPRRSRRRRDTGACEQSRMLVGDTQKPSFVSSAQLRRCPQRGFSRASRSTSSRISRDSGGRATCRVAGAASAPATGTSAVASAGSPAKRLAAAAADGRLRRPAAPGQPSGASAARPAGAGSIARAAARVARCLSRPRRAGSERARPVGPNGELEEQEGQAPDPPNRPIQRQRHQYWRRSGAACGATNVAKATPSAESTLSRRRLWQYCCEL